MSIVFNFSGPVTINVSGNTTIALPGTPADAPAFVACVGEGSGCGSGCGHPATSHTEPSPGQPDTPAGRIDKEILLTMLNDPKYRFRKIGTLADAIEESEEYTEGLLADLGARQEDSNDELWGLISRVGAGRDHDDVEGDLD